MFLLLHKTWCNMVRDTELIPLLGLPCSVEEPHLAQVSGVTASGATSLLSGVHISSVLPQLTRSYTFCSQDLQVMGCRRSKEARFSSVGKISFGCYTCMISQFSLVSDKYMRVSYGICVCSRVRPLWWRGFQGHGAPDAARVPVYERPGHRRMRQAYCHHHTHEGAARFVGRV